RPLSGRGAALTSDSFRFTIRPPEDEAGHNERRSRVVRRKRFQRGWLLKIGKRRKVWVGRWREDVLLEGGQVGRVQRSLLLGTVAELRTRRDAQARLDETLVAVNAGSSRPESSVTFGWFVEQQWTPL